MTKEFIIHTGAFGSEMDIINKYAGTADITRTEGSKPECIAENPWVRESLIWGCGTGGGGRNSPSHTEHPKWEGSTSRCKKGGAREIGSLQSCLSATKARALPINE